MQQVNIELDSRWVRVAKSPAMVILSGLKGVSVTFAPLFLYWSGTGKFYPAARWVIVPLCFAIIFLVPMIYFLLGEKVVRELRKAPVDRTRVGTNGGQET